MYTIGATFKSMQQARRVSTALSGALRTLGFDAYVSHFRVSNDFFVGLITDDEESQIAQDIKEIIQRHLGQGQICALAPQALGQLQQRRKRERKRQEDRETQRRFLEDRAAFLAELEERWMKASWPDSSTPLDGEQKGEWH